jgi:DNA-binding transcriptional regulator YiaG
MVGDMAMARISDLHRKWMKEPKYRKGYEALEEEFVLASAVIVIDARNRAGLTQQQLARKMGTTQPVVARLESGRVRSLDADAGAPREGNRIAVANQLRAAQRQEAPGMRKKYGGPVQGGHHRQANDAAEGWIVSAACHAPKEGTEVRPWKTNFAKRTQLNSSESTAIGTPLWPPEGESGCSKDGQSAIPRFSSPVWPKRLSEGA